MALINEFFQSRTADPKTSLGTHWEPGRKILDNHFLDIPDADKLVPGAFSAFERIYFTGEPLHL
jgi:trans-aconitate 3-methyltransferase